MKRILFFAAFLISSFAVFAQQASNTLLWRVSGNGLQKPTYIFGTIHMLCAEDIQISDSLNNAIANADQVYLELDMDNVFEMIGAMNKLKMRNDTTLADLLTPAQYDSVKTFFKQQNSLLPFSMLERYKPMLATSTIMQSSMDCDKPVAMEQMVMKAAKSERKGVKGLETMAYQASIFDSIPYKLQAEQLYETVANWGKDTSNAQLDRMTRAYRLQNLDTLEKIMMEDEMGNEYFGELLLYRRNEAWAKKLAALMKENSLVVAVGAGHLPGKRGVLQLLRNAGYKVEPVENDMQKKLPVKTI